MENNTESGAITPPLTSSKIPPMTPIPFAWFGVTEAINCGMLRKGERVVIKIDGDKVLASHSHDGYFIYVDASGYSLLMINAAEYWPIPE
jgi:hypothetical protein